MRSLGLFLLVFLVARGDPAAAQVGARRAIDLILVLDNSCSMFPRERLIPGCTSYGSDPDYLRIRGADIFIARLGFGDPNEADYQLGVVSLGDRPTLISPLQPVLDSRDRLAGKIANPNPEKATRFVPALQMAYDELRKSPNRRPANVPAVVLITDGVPYPPEGQSEADIERLIQAHADIPLFLILLKGTDTNVEEFDRYANFWQDVQVRYPNVFLYLIEKATQIEDTYNQIVSLLQETVPAQAVQVTPGKEMRFYVSPYVKRFVLTVSYPTNASRGGLRLIDPLGHGLERGQPGVNWFRGVQNPVEVISIAAPRLAPELTGQYWTLQSDWVVSVFVDREGAYRIHWLEPETVQTEVANVYLAKDVRSPRTPFHMRFELVGEDGSNVLEPQPVLLEVYFPDAGKTQLPVDLGLKPDSNGVYDLDFDFTTFYPYISTQFERLAFVLQVGSSDPQAEIPVPIATSRLLVNLGPIPYIQIVSPASIDCLPGSPAKILVALGDTQLMAPQSLTAHISSESGDVPLSLSGNELHADLSALCHPLIARLSCGGQAQAEFTLKIEGSLQSGEKLPPIERLIPVQVEAAECTPTPSPITSSTFVLPTPLPTAVPDSDHDGRSDPIDRCPDQPGLALFGGCPTPWGLIVLVLGVLMALFFGFIFPWLTVNFLHKPLEAYLLVCRKGAEKPELVDLRRIAIRRRTLRLKIGGHPRKAHVYIHGLKPVEFIVQEKDGRLLLLDPRGETQATFRQLNPEKVPTSNPEIKLWLATRRAVLDAINC